MNDLMIPSLNIDDLGDKAPRCANNKGRGRTLNCKMKSYVYTESIVRPTISKCMCIEGCIVVEPCICATNSKLEGV